MARLVRRIILTVALALVAPMSAQQPGTGYHPDAQELLSIDAQNLSVDDMLHTATFSGNVVVSKGALQAQCSRLVLHYHGNVVDGMACEPDYFHDYFHLID